MKFFYSTVFFFLTCGLSAQNLPVLSLPQVIEIGLAQNFGIKILQGDVSIANNNATRANAGFLPTVGLQANLSPSLGYTNQAFASGAEINRFNIANNFSAGVFLNWTLYDGRRMYFTYDRLQALRGVSEGQIRVRSEAVVAQVMQAYFNIVRHQMLGTAFEKQLDLFEERLRLAETRLEVGKGNKLDVLQAQADLATQKTGILRQNQAIVTAKYLLKQTMNEFIDPLISPFFIIADSFTFNENYDFEALEKRGLLKNPQLALLRKQQTVFQISEQEASTLNKPRLVLNSAFNFGRTDNRVGFALLNQNTGFNLGVSLTYPIFDAGNTKRQVQNAQIEYKSSEIRLQQAEAEWSSALTIAYQDYQNALEILTAERETMRLAQESIDLAMERFRLSRATILELKLIQKTYEDAQIRAISAMFEAKRAEIELRRLGGLLTQ
jgi:outer membrane protein